MKKLILFLQQISITFALFSQSPTIEWAKCLGGFYPDYGYSIQQTTDGGYIVAGETNSNDGNVSGNHGTNTTDFWIVKLNSSGNIVWQKSLGGTLNERATDIKQTNDGGYIVAGFCQSTDGDVTINHGSEDYWVVKLNSSGNIQWQKSLGGSLKDWAECIQQTSDHGYIVAGKSNSTDGDITNNIGDMDYWVVKLDSTGKIQWQKSFGGTYVEIPFSLLQLNDGSYVIAGMSESVDVNVSGNHGWADFWIIKIDSDGNLLWQKTLGGSLFEVAKSIKQTYDGGFIIAGMSESTDGNVTINHGKMDQWVVKTNSSGDIEWQNSFGGYENDYAFSVQPINDGYVVTGYTESNDSNIIGNHGLRDIWLIKVNSNGNLEWQKTFGGTNDETAQSIIQTNDGNLIFIGNTSSYNGNVSGNHGSIDYWVAKISLPTFVKKYTFPDKKIIIYPTIVNSILTIEKDKTDQLYTISIYDINGIEIQKEELINSEIKIDVSKYQNGIYFVKAKTENNLAVFKFIKN